MTHRFRRVLLSALWTMTVAVSALVLHRVGSGALSTPPFTDLARLRTWIADRDAVTAAFAVLRLVALVFACYLLAVTVLGLLARASRIPKLVTFTDAGTIPAVRRLLGTVAGLGLTASAATLIIGPTLADHDGGGVTRDSVVLERLPDGSSLVIERLADDESGGGTATMRVVDPDDAAPTPSVTWTTTAGDHFWGMARLTLAEAWHRSPNDAEISSYWRLIVDVNRTKLVDPANPDLIYPRQTFELPAPPAEPG